MVHFVVLAREDLLHTAHPEIRMHLCGAFIDESRTQQPLESFLRTRGFNTYPATSTSSADIRKVDLVNLPGCCMVLQQEQPGLVAHIILGRCSMFTSKAGALPRRGHH